MKKQKVNYCLERYAVLKHSPIKAKKEISFEIKLASQLLLDELVVKWNKSNLEQRINQAIDNQDETAFQELSKSYQAYAYEF
ncbi:IDEAL domain-containing protein [Paraliobacillus salinarum]|uniref:IDEAL domain-containing protein n=1 Tax=Paraliobacillus salinarum TaxID=1158996 RepID=UPI0015F4599A|nr:IDEAL domain-containing protein [Paraliobacillus salinarum]